MQASSSPTGQSAVKPIVAFSADQALRYSVTVWCLIALLGQWLFAFYVATLYGVPVVTGDYAAANLARPITGFVEGDGFGNTMMFAHVIPAALLSIGGVLQLIPWLRRQQPGLHRWNGRLFLTLGCVAALTGLYLTWGRGSRLSDLGAIGITVNGMLIPFAAMLAWRYARARHWQQHCRWAIHAFLLINGVWTFRLYLMAWYVLNQGPNGNNAQLDGPMDLAMSFACYGLPMAVAELLFWAQRQSDANKKWLVAGVMVMGCLLTATGVLAAAFLMWLPRIRLVVVGI